MEEFEKQPEMQKSIELSPVSLSYLAETAKWAKFLAIIGFVGVGLMVLLALFMFIAGTIIPDFSGGGFPFPMGILGLVYIGMAVIYFFLSWYLMKFANLAKTALEQSNSAILEESLQNHKSFYKFAGIMTIVVLALYALIIVGVVIAGIVGALS